MSEREILGPMEKHPDPASCEHVWEPHLWERGKLYCPYCATTVPGDYQEERP